MRDALWGNVGQAALTRAERSRRVDGGGRLSTLRLRGSPSFEVGKHRTAHVALRQVGGQGQMAQGLVRFLFFARFNVWASSTSSPARTAARAATGSPLRINPATVK